MGGITYNILYFTLVAKLLKYVKLLINNFSKFYIFAR
jgi:hypothetical protein